MRLNDADELKKHAFSEGEFAPVVLVRDIDDAPHNRDS